ncbi:glycosyl hydrolase family 15 [Arthrobacter sp. Soil736]|uniref:glycoside hydrolase family 15 protein n=1 Tax=Arthrobacter sp. Soil736 TaxID=1736395 RepID=UPI0006FB3275|nr:glycoside hydrolase family 15 protein [Arthrobacter sp. Soil736]KRE59412.1 glycosyl hydrolase family 15 [Arthrobacter sp. Soil736]
MRIDAGSGAQGRRRSGAGTSLYPPIADYGFLSDCEANCLIASSGQVEWMCVPRHDSPSVFSTMLDRAAGGFKVAPYGVREPTARRYLPGSLILETTWQTRTGWLIVRDALVMGPWHHTEERAGRYRRPPTNYEAEHCLLRTVRCVNGAVELSVLCEPVFGYGRRRARWEFSGPGYGEVVTVSGDEGDPVLRLTTDRRLGIEDSIAVIRSRMTEGEQAFIALSWGSLPPPRTWEEATRKQWQTTEFWRQWITGGEFPDHPWREELQRSALTLKGLTYAPTGALVAAPTTSLPETPGGERNWDYRYRWVRDSTFALWALYTLGLDREADDFFAFIRDVAAEDDLQIMYGIDGERDLPEVTVEGLGGYDGARPVRIGNAAAHQRQLDVWGTMLDSVYLHAKSRDQLPEPLWPVLLRQVEQAAAHWRDPDHGIWEVRGEPKQFTSSKLMCWVALDRGARLARLHGQADYARKWDTIAEEIHEDICRNGVDDRGVFVQSYGTTNLDASLLLVPLVRFLPANDPRVRATVLAIADELTRDGLVLRYRPEQTDDGLTGVEGTFTTCSFWLVSALVEIGEVVRAMALCERLLSLASPLGLYAEELDPLSGRHLGNFPQAFTHLALLNALVHLIRAEETNRAAQFAPAHRNT